MFGVTLLALHSFAQAACTVVATAPDAGITATDSPTFTWGGNCASYRMQFSPSGTFTSDTTSTASQVSRTYTFDGEAWDTAVAGWGSQVTWRVEGVDSVGTPSFTLGRDLYLDPDDDDDGWSVAEGDCDDGDAATYPDAAEVCDGIDQDCDGTADNGLTYTTWYGDLDLDGYGLDTDTVSTCDGAPAGYVALGGDCDDGDDAISPGVAEVCGDGIDQNCNGSVDECGLGGDVPLSDADVRILGYRGYYLTAMPFQADVDGDGIVDLLAGTYTRPVGRNRGAVYGWYGPITGDEGIGSADFRIDGLTDAGNFGYYGESAGDVNGDGFQDFLFTGTGNGGTSYLFLGPLTAGRHTTDEAVATFHAYDSGDGAFVAIGVGDLNGDGYDDIATGAYAYDDNGLTTAGGWVDLWHGPITGDWYAGEGDTSYYPDAASNFLGYGVAGGDVDGDGYSDLVLVSPLEYELVSGEGGNYASTVRVCYGPHLWGGLVTDECTEGVFGSRASTYLGYSNRVNNLRLADLDDDGRLDILVGAPNDARNSAGILYGCLAPFDTLRSAATCEIQVWGTGPGWTDLGAQAAVGDLDGDGVLDLVASDPGGRSPVDSANGGRLAVYFGPLDGLGTVSVSDADATIYGTTNNAAAGTNPTIVDLDGDGDGDLVFGAPGAAVGGANAGSVAVFFGGAL